MPDSDTKRNARDAPSGSGGRTTHASIRFAISQKAIKIAEVVMNDIIEDELDLMEGLVDDIRVIGCQHSWIPFVDGFDKCLCCGEEREV